MFTQYTREQGLINVHYNNAFNKTRQGTRIRELKRPTFKPDLHPIPKPAREEPPLVSKRSGKSHTLDRPVFRRDAIKGRRLDEADTAVPIEIGEKTISKLFKIEVPDLNDRIWIKEKNKRLSAGETLENIMLNPPLGRLQRTVSKEVNFSQQSLNLDEKIQLIHQAVVHGKNDGEVIGKIMDVLNNPDEKNPITSSQAVSLDSDIRTLNLPKDPVEYKLTQRFYSPQQYMHNKPTIDLFLARNKSKLADPRRPVENVKFSTGNKRPVLISTIKTILNKPRSFKMLDIHSNQIIDFRQYIKLIDNGALDKGFDIASAEKQQKEAREQEEGKEQTDEDDTDIEEEEGEIEQQIREEAEEAEEKSEEEGTSAPRANPGFTDLSIERTELTSV